MALPEQHPSTHSFGEVPRYIRGRFVQRYINRHLQISFPFPEYREASEPVLPKPVYRDNLGRKVDMNVWFRQPRRFPVGYWRRPMANDPEWRAKYLADWIERRKAKGLPHEVTDPIWFKKPVKSVRPSVAAKKATA